MSISGRKLQAVADLREKLQGQLGLKTQAFLSWTLWEPGLPRPGLVEISGSIGSGKTEAVLFFLREHPELRVAWLEENFNFFPSCLGHHQLQAERFLFIHAGKNIEWTFQQVISAQIFDVVLLSGVKWNETSLRRAQLFSEKNNTSVVCLQNESSKKAWAFDFQLESFRTPLGVGLRPNGSEASMPRSARILSLRGEKA